MLGSLKNSSSVRSPNFPYEKLKMLGIEFRFDRKIRPSMESQPSFLLLVPHSVSHFFLGLNVLISRMLFPFYQPCILPI